MKTYILDFQILKDNSRFQHIHLSIISSKQYKARTKKTLYKNHVLNITEYRKHINMEILKRQKVMTL